MSGTGTGYAASRGLCSKVSGTHMSTMLLPSFHVLTCAGSAHYQLYATPAFHVGSAHYQLYATTVVSRTDQCSLSARRTPCALSYTGTG
eukprot:180934-Rhodomonas_salina.3